MDAPPDGCNFSFYASLALGLSAGGSKPIVPTTAFCFPAGPNIQDTAQAKVQLAGEPFIRAVGAFRAPLGSRLHFKAV